MIIKSNLFFQAFIIAFTSNFIPRLVYRLTETEDNSLTGFLNYSMSTYYNLNVSTPDNTCRYPDYREPSDSVNEYQYTRFFWHVLAARLAFVVVFEVLTS